ncbi:DUF2933 domain-containing protein [Hahella sp. SMD15-11]|uniref:DUF2933 domain-containing protein n=1 Tax=Thermohahella caldifontis TaxID=3142973 RepID=A0AB39USQ6_9GAMM
MKITHTMKVVGATLVVAGVSAVQSGWISGRDLLFYGLLLACPLMHVFMHGGHGHGKGHHDHDAESDAQDPEIRKLPDQR